MSLHDRMVMNIAAKDLHDGCAVEIGDRVKDRQRICKILKTRFPLCKISTYVDNELVEVIG